MDDRFGTRDQDIELAQSSDGGVTWKALKNVSHHNGKPDWSPDVAISPTSALATYGTAVGTCFGCPSDLGLTRVGLDGAVTTASVPNSGFIISSHAASNGAGAYHVVYSPNDTGVRIVSSTDDGRTWTSPSDLSATALRGSAADGPFPDVDAAGDVVGATWRSAVSYDANPDVFVRVSRDGAASWDQQVQLTNTPQRESVASVAVRGSTIVVTWLTARASDLTTLDSAYSTDAGVTWSTPSSLASIPAGNIAGDGSQTPATWPLATAQGFLLSFRGSASTLMSSDGASWQPGPTLPSLAPTPIAQSATHLLGSASSTVLRQYEDSAVPTVTFTKPAATPVKGGGYQSVAFQVTDADSSTFTLACAVDNNPVQCGPATPGAEVALSVPPGSNGSHTLAVTATDPGGNSARATTTWVTDTLAPAANTSLPAPPPVTVTPAMSIRIGAIDRTSGVQSLDVRYRAAPFNGAFSGFVAPATWQTTRASSVSLSGTRGSTYCFSIRARDNAGNVSAWFAERCTAVPLDDRALSASAGWTRPSGSAYYAGTTSTVARAGATLTKSGLQSRRVYLVASTCSGCGVVGVYWNGSLVKQVSLNAAAAHKRVFLLRDFGAVKVGTLSIKTLSAGRVYVDAVGLSRS